MKQFAVIGLGNFGLALVRALISQGNEVMALDSDEERVSQVRDIATQAVVGDCKNEQLLAALGLKDFDCVVVALGQDKETNLLVSLLCREMGAKMLVSRATSELHARVLEKIGVDKVIYPERDMAARLAHTLTSQQVMEVIQLSEDYSLVELEVPGEWFGKTLRELNIRQAFGMNVIAIRRGGQTHISPRPDDLLMPEDTVSVVSSNESISRWEEHFAAKAKSSELF